eukprot:9908900-Alexandrium_andersonii.AAC.1
MSLMWPVAPRRPGSGLRWPHLWCFARRARARPARGTTWSGGPWPSVPRQLGRVQPAETPPSSDPP